ncbi:MAG: methyl-accepting chemotaxis protein [Paracoccaceae bacterium]|nr:methyl-accepting chemotaxis protein [Paracoccaceae bacterium]
MSIHRQLLTIVIVPFVGLVILGAILVVDQTRTFVAAQEARATASHAVHMSKIVHALQVERGQSAGHIASSGANFADTLPDVRQAADQAIQALPAALRADLTWLTALPERRAGVDALTLALPDMAAWYTASIREAMTLVDHMLIEFEDPSILRLGAGYIALSEAKEAAGLQRAAGATGLAAGVFQPQQFNAFIARGAVEAKFLDVAKLELNTVLNGVDFAGLQADTGVAAFRTAIIAEGASSAPADLTVPDWFARSTAWIDALHDIELRVTDTIATLAAANARTAFYFLAGTLALVALVICVALLLGMKVRRSVRKSFEALENAMERLGRKEFDMRTREQDLDTEVGRLFAAIDQTRNELQKADAQLLEADAARVGVLADMERALKQLSGRDLSCKIDGAFPEEYLGLQEAFEKAVQQLAGAMATVQSAVSAVETASSELDAVTGDMALRTSSQAASLEQTTAALTELTSRVQNAADMAGEADDASMKLKQDAAMGKQTVDETLPIVERISQASNKMAAMVTLIDDIAFQTNLLALNAGVEAARAGEAGRGFAVVAGEVRSLAVQAGNTASEINGLIQETIETVQSGVKMVGEMAEAFRQIDHRANDATKAVSQVKTEADAQARAITEIRTAITSLDEVTQHNAAMVDQCSTMATSLGEKANDVHFLMSSFTVPEDAQAQDMGVTPKRLAS